LTPFGKNESSGRHHGSLSASHGIKRCAAAGLDPANSMMIGNDHIVLAQGRDYADISPVAGIILGSREQDVDVQVDVVPRL